MALITRTLPLRRAGAGAQEPESPREDSAGPPSAPLEELAALLGAARAGRGSVAVVAAAPGFGKSVLLDAFAELAASRRVPTVRTVAEPPEAAGPSVAEQLAAALGRPPRSAADRRRLAREAADRALDAARRQALVVTVDDAQFADGASAASLARLAHGLPGTRLLLVLAWRDTVEDEGAAFWTVLHGHWHTRDLRLPVLTGAGVRALATRATGEVPADAVTAAVLAASGGNPLLAAGLVDDFRAQRTPDGPDPSVAPALAYRRAVQALLHRGGPGFRSAAQGLAVLGDPGHLEALTGLAPGSGRPALALLRRSGLWGGTAFAHPAARAAVLDDLGPRARNELFLRAVRIERAAGRPETELAARLVEAGPPRPAWTVALLESAARVHAGRGELERAAELLILARESAPDPAEADRLTGALVRVRWPGDPALAAQHIGELAAAPAPSDGLALGRALIWLGRPEPARPFLSGALPAIRSGDEAAAAEAAYTRIWLAVTYPSSADAVATAAEAVPPRPTRRYEAISTLRDLLSGASPRHAAARAARLLESMPDGEHRPDEALETAESALCALLYAGRTQAAAAHAERLAAAPTPFAAPAARARLLALRAEIALRQGEFVAATEGARAALGLLAPESWGIALGLPVGVLVLALTARGRRQEAAAALDLPLPAAAFESRYAIPYLTARAGFRSAQGDPARAAEDYRAVRRLAEAWDMDVPGLADWRGGLAEALLANGEADRARALAEHTLDRFGAEEHPAAHARALRLLAATAPIDQRGPLLRRAAHLLGPGHPYELARALADLTETYAATGQTRRARAVAGQGRTLAQACDARPLLDRLEGAGEPAVIRRPPAAGRSAGLLSPAEARVAGLAAMGDTNQEISRSLYITKSTVEQHLTKIYRKLGISGRTELAAHLTATSPARAASPSPRLDQGVHDS